jgi:hypothetical protein
VRRSAFLIVEPFEEILAPNSLLGAAGALSEPLPALLRKGDDLSEPTAPGTSTVLAATPSAAGDTNSKIFPLLVSPAGLPGDSPSASPTAQSTGHTFD